MGKRGFVPYLLFLIARPRLYRYQGPLALPPFEACVIAFRVPEQPDLGNQLPQMLTQFGIIWVEDLSTRYIGVAGVGAQDTHRQ